MSKIYFKVTDKTYKSDSISTYNCEQVNGNQHRQNRILPACGNQYSTLEENTSHLDNPIVWSV